MLQILAADAPNGNFIPGDPNEFWWGLAAFSIVFGVFLWKGVPLISRLMKERTASIEQELADARHEREEAQAETAQLTAQLGDAAGEGEQIIAAAREQAVRVEADLISRAEADIDDARSRARIEIQAQRDQALADLRTALAAQAKTAADAVVLGNLDDEGVQRDLIDDYITNVAAG
jgi:F-type H+-transporting ATPase subunit b